MVATHPAVPVQTRTRQEGSYCHRCMAVRQAWDQHRCGHSRAVRKLPKNEHISTGKSFHWSTVCMISPMQNGTVRLGKQTPKWPTWWWWWRTNPAGTFTKVNIYVQWTSYLLQTKMLWMFNWTSAWMLLIMKLLCGGSSYPHWSNTNKWFTHAGICQHGKKNKTMGKIM